MVFYYTYWEFEENQLEPAKTNRFNSDILLFSIALLVNVYPESQIKIIVYNQIPDSFKIFKLFQNVTIINLKPYINKKQEQNELLNIKHNNCKHSPLLLSKPIDVFNIAKQNNENFILLDIDFFLFKPFQNLDFTKVGFLYYNQNVSNVNTGLVASGTTSFECNYFFELYESFLKLFNNEKETIKNKIIYNVYNTHESLQEEIVMSNITQKFKELKDLVFYDITNKNHQLYWPELDLDYQNNIHAYKLLKKRICPVLTQCEYIQKVLINKNIQDKLKHYMKEQEFNQEEQRLIKNINDSMPVKDKRIFL
jgi:hypothetical protein